MIIHRLMILVHKAVIKEIVVLEKAIQTCVRMLSQRQN
jgi:hypothetical protein